MQSLEILIYIHTHSDTTVKCTFIHQLLYYLSHQPTNTSFHFFYLKASCFTNGEKIVDDFLLSLCFHHHHHRARKEPSPVYVRKVVNKTRQRNEKVFPLFAKVLQDASPLREIFLRINNIMVNPGRRDILLEGEEEGMMGNIDGS